MIDKLLSYSFADIDVVLIEIMYLDIFSDLAGYAVLCHAMLIVVYHAYTYHVFFYVI